MHRGFAYLDNNFQLVGNDRKRSQLTSLSYGEINRKRRFKCDQTDGLVEFLKNEGFI